MTGSNGWYESPDSAEVRTVHGAVLSGRMTTKVHERISNAIESGDADTLAKVLETSSGVIGAAIDG